MRGTTCALTFLVALAAAILAHVRSRETSVARIHWCAPFLALVFVLHAGCGPSDVERTLECLNTDGTQRAVLWFRGGGGAAGWSFTSVSIIPASASSADIAVLEQGRVFDASHAVDVVLRWRQAGELEIERPKDVSVYRALANAKSGMFSVRVEYKVSVGDALGETGDSYCMSKEKKILPSPQRLR